MHGEALSPAPIRRFPVLLLMCSLVLPGSLGCASSTPPPQAFSTTRDRLAELVKTLFVLRRDGYLAEALSGRPVQCVGPVEVRDGGLRAGTFEVDNFYRRDGNQRWQRVEMPASSASASR
ncbi:hypothetical protein [Archangium lipolyticum]|uniref:hypothetical protein n=1 Tax=Archangium lipolyticum TaxID=2970465 RepID=UPI00214A3B56|nr:hypothetical protein [Archangium lipolyticum]